MSRDFLAEAQARQVQVVALLTAQLDDLRRVDGTSPLHDRLVVARDCCMEALRSIEDLSRSPAPAAPAA